MMTDTMPTDTWPFAPAASQCNQWHPVTVINDEPSSFPEVEAGQQVLLHALTD